MLRNWFYDVSTSPQEESRPPYATGRQTKKITTKIRGQTPRQNKKVIY